MRTSSLRLDINIEFLCLESRDARAKLDIVRCAGPHYRRETIFTVGTCPILWTTQKLATLCLKDFNLARWWSFAGQRPHNLKINNIFEQTLGSTHTHHNPSGGFYCIIKNEKCNINIESISRPMDNPFDRTPSLTYSIFHPISKREQSLESIYFPLKSNILYTQTGRL